MNVSEPTQVSSSHASRLTVFLSFLYGFPLSASIFVGTMDRSLILL